MINESGRDGANTIDSKSGEAAAVTSRDGSNRNYRAGTPGSEPRRAPQRSGASWEVGADDLDRYMSGDQQRFDPYGSQEPRARRQQQPTRSIPAEPQYEEPQDFDEYDEFEEDEYYEEPVRRRAPARQAPRQRQPEPEYYDDDLYDDPYVMDEDEEAPRQRRSQQRRPQRPAGADRQKPSVQLPKALTEAPILQDRVALGMLVTLVVSTLAMIIVTLMQRDSLGPIIFTHVNADGGPEELRGSAAIWRLPIIGAAVAIINIVLAWFMSRWQQFLPRFVLGGGIGVHFVVWVAIIAYFF